MAAPGSAAKRSGPTGRRPRWPRSSRRVSSRVVQRVVGDRTSGPLGVVPTGRSRACSELVGIRRRRPASSWYRSVPRAWVTATMRWRRLGSPPPARCRRRWPGRSIGAPLPANQRWPGIQSASVSSNVILPDLPRRAAMQRPSGSPPAHRLPAHSPLSGALLTAGGHPVARAAGTSRTRVRAGSADRAGPRSAGR